MTTEVEKLAPCVHCGGNRRRLPSGKPYCPDCKKAYNAANRDKRKEYNKAYHKQHWEKNGDKIKEKRKNWSPERKAANKEYLRQYRIDNREELSAKQKQYNIENAEWLNANRKKYREANKERISEKNRTHYLNNQEDRIAYSRNFRAERMHPEYKIWDGMKQRCINETSHAFDDWGGRGITMCDRWLVNHEGFDNFIEDMGPRPEPKHLYSINRIDNNKGYYKENCEWATKKEQANNRRARGEESSFRNRLNIPDSFIIERDNRKMSLKEFSEETGIFLIIVKYRWARHPMSIDWILDESDDNRFYNYHNHNYNLFELSLISGIKQSISFTRIIKQGWTVEQAVSTPVDFD